MKKIAIAFGVLLAFYAQAASINWTITGSTTYVMKDYLNNDFALQTVYLIAAEDVSSITYVEGSKELTKNQFYDALSDLQIASATTAADGTKPSVSKQPVTSDLMTAGTRMTFGFLMVSEDAQGNGFYRLLTNQGTPYETGASASAQTTFSSAYNTLGGKSWTKAYAVPEPSTAMLALAGLALLIKRRRA